MKRHYSSNRDCYRDCPDGGYAFFVERYGPCETGCDDARFGRTILRMGWHELDRLRTSGSMEDFPARNVGDFAVALMQLELPFNLVTLDMLSGLAELAGAPDDHRITFPWQDQRLGGLLEGLLQASGSAMRA